MNRRNLVLVAIASVTLSCAYVVSRIWYSSDAEKDIYRENPAQLLPHQLENISKCIDSLKRESFNDSLKIQCFAKKENDNSTCDRLANHASEGSDRKIDSPFVRQNGIVRALSNRRILKLLSDIRESPDSRLRSIDCFERVLSHFNRVVFTEFFTRDMCFYECRALSFALICVGEFGNSKDLLRALDDIAKSKEAFVNQLKETGKKAQVAPEKYLFDGVYPDNRLVFNLVIWKIQASGGGRSVTILCQDMQKGKMPVERWDSPFTTMEARPGLYLESQPYPAYVKLLDNSKDYIIYDWPDAFYFDSDKQIERVREAVEALRRTIHEAAHDQSRQPSKKKLT